MGPSRPSRASCASVFVSSTRSGYLIAPVVVWSPGVTVTPNPAEVAAAYRIACRELFRDGSPEIVAIEESDRPIIRLPLPVANVNAPTAAVLYQFREVALAGRDTRVAVLVDRHLADAGDAAVGLGGRESELGDVGDHAQRIARPHRPRELDLAD